MECRQISNISAEVVRKHAPVKNKYISESAVHGQKPQKTHNEKIKTTQYISQGENRRRGKFVTCKEITA